MPFQHSPPAASNKSDSMNYLAHLALAPATHAAQVGNLLGDFIKGTEESLRQQLPAELVDGIMLHRAIDKFTDQHPAFLASKALLAPERRRFAGVVLDLIYDHFLSIHWDDFYDQPLDDFIEQIYAAIELNKDWQLGTLKEAFPYMKSQNWLASYGTREGIKETFWRVSNRSKFTSAIEDTYIDLDTHYEIFEQHFFLLYRDLITFVENYTSLEL